MPSFSSVLLHIWCCYKTYTIKGLLLCPWCVVTGKPASPETQLYYYTTRTTTGHHATNHFFREKSRKKLGQIAFLLGQYAQKACFARARLLPCLEGTIRRKGKQSFFSCSGFLRLLFGAFIRLPKAKQRAQKVWLNMSHATRYQC